MLRSTGGTEKIALRKQHSWEQDEEQLAKVASFKYHAGRKGTHTFFPQVKNGTSADIGIPGN